MKWLVFTDLDGTLLDAETYSFQKAQDALSFLKNSRIPVIPCTSKTHLEVIEIRKELNLHDPFIVENGSAVLFPKGYFAPSAEQTISIDGYDALILGKTYTEIKMFLKELKETYNLSLKGFNEMTLAEIQHYSGLDPERAQMAKKRRFSEPFVLTGGKADSLEHIKEFILSRGFRLLRGNRFFHLLGNCDKGKAAAKLIGMFKEKFDSQTFHSIGIGDSMNDLEMLEVVNTPVLVKKLNGKYVDQIELNNLMRSKGIGPEGWNEAVFKIIKNTPLLHMD